MNYIHKIHIYIYLIPINNTFLIYLKIETELKISEKVNKDKLLKINTPLFLNKTIKQT